MPTLNTIYISPPEEWVPNGDDNCSDISNEDQWNYDADAQGDVCDPDDDNDTVLDGDDTDPFDAYICLDADADGCDDCSQQGSPDTSNDGADNESDGICDAGDDDDEE